MTLAAVQGQPRAVQVLEAALAHRTLHHAYLFVGAEGVGKELAAKAFAQALLCADAPFRGCGRCGSCERVVRDRHPDLALLAPEETLVARGLMARADLAGTPSRIIRVE